MEKKNLILVVGSTEKANLLASFLITSLYNDVIFCKTSDDLQKITEHQSNIDVIVDLDFPEKIMENLKIYKKIDRPFMVEIKSDDILSKVRKEVSDGKINALIDPEFDIGSAFKKILDIKLQKISLPDDIEVEKDDLEYDKFSNSVISRESYIYKDIFFIEINWKKANKTLWLKSVLLGIDFIKERKFYTGTIFQMKDIFEK